MLNESAEVPASQALRRFLAERPDLFQQKRLVVFSFNSPYYLDATNISKITAYFGLYSKSPSFFEVAARLLFRELSPEGALPVSVPGIGYDLISATSPNPDQIIPLFFDSSLPVESETPTGPATTTTPEPASSPEFQLGALIPVRTGVIYDHNGNPVPDDTTVQFLITINGEVNTLLEAETASGIAQAGIQGISTGKWEVRAVSEPARQSDVLHFEIPSETGEIITITPTPMPTQTPTPTETPTVTPPILTTPEPPQEARPDLSDWTMSILLTTIVGLASYRLAAQVGQVRWGVRGGFISLIGGLAAYSYLALGLPGSQSVLEKSGAWGIIPLHCWGACLASP
jgi:beta-N-acetylhexosaminidase